MADPYLQGAAGYYPTAGSYEPYYGGFTPRTGFQTGFGGVADAFFNRFMGTLNIAVQGPASPAERYLGMQFAQQRSIAFGDSVRADVDQLTRGRINMAEIRQGKALDAATRARYATQAEEMVRAGGHAFEVATAFGYENLLGDIPGFRQRRIALGVFEGMRYMPGAGLVPSMQNALKLSAQLMPTQLGTTLTAPQIGNLVQTLGQRGLLTGRADTLNQEATTQRIKGQLKRWSKIVDGLQSIFQGEDNPEVLLTKLNQVTQGGLHAASATQLNSIVTRMRMTRLATGLTGEQIASQMAYSAQNARQLGLVPTVGAVVGLESLTIGKAMAEGAQNISWFGKRGPEEMAGIVNRRALLFQASATARIGGGLLASIRERARMRFGADADKMSLTQMVGRLGGSRYLRNLVSSIEGGRNLTAVAGELEPEDVARLSQELGGIGMNQTAAYNMLTSNTREGQEMAMAHMRDVGAAAQRRTAINTVAGRLGGELEGRFGIGATQAVGVMRSVLGAMENVGFDVVNPQTGQRTIANALRGAGLRGNATITAAAANLYTNIKTAFENDSDLARFGGFPEFFGGKNAEAATKRTMRALATITGASDLLAGMGSKSKTVIGRIIEDMLTPDREGKRRDVWGVVETALGVGNVTPEDVGRFSSIVENTEELRGLYDKYYRYQKAGKKMSLQDIVRERELRQQIKDEYATLKTDSSRYSMMAYNEQKRKKAEESTKTESAAVNTEHTDIHAKGDVIVNAQGGTGSDGSTRYTKVIVEAETVDANIGNFTAVTNSKGGEQKT